MRHTFPVPSLCTKSRKKCALLSKVKQTRDTEMCDWWGKRWKVAEDWCMPYILQLIVGSFLEGKRSDSVREVRSDKSVAIITQQLWCNKAFSSTSSCPPEISTMRLNLWTFQQLLEPALAMLIGVYILNTGESNNATKICFFQNKYTLKNDKCIFTQLELL